MKENIVPRYSLTLGHLYPDQLNLYGDRGNILTLRRRCDLRGIELRVVGLGIGDALAPDEYNMLFIGGGQDKEQAPVAQDLYEMKGIGLWAAIEDDMPVLAVCGGYQLLAHYYRPAQGPDMRGLGVFDAWTIHKGPQVPRCIGNIAISWNDKTLVGFENHGGRTYLGTAKPLGKVLKVSPHSMIHWNGRHTPQCWNVWDYITLLLMHCVHRRGQIMEMNKLNTLSQERRRSGRRGRFIVPTADLSAPVRWPEYFVTSNYRAL